MGTVKRKPALSLMLHSIALSNDSKELTTKKKAKGKKKMRGLIKIRDGKNQVYCDKY